MILTAFLALGLCASSSLAHININYPLGQWDFTETEQESGAFCGGGSSTGPSPWLAQNPFISLSGDAGESVTVRFAYSNSNANGSGQFVDSIDSLRGFNTTLIVNATLPDSGNLCVDTILPPLEIGAIGVIHVAALNPETGTNVSSCATIEYIPESLDGQIVPDTNITYRAFYCSNSTDLPVAESSCDCHCHDADEHCTGDCSNDEIDAARDQCTTEYESNNPGTQCDCHCHGAEEHCSGSCTEQQTNGARAECVAAAGGTNATNAAATSTSATGSGATASATGAASNLVAVSVPTVGLALLFYAFMV